MSSPPSSAQHGLADPSHPEASAFGLALAALIMAVFGFIWLGWGFSASTAFTNFSPNAALPAARWILFYVVTLILLAGSVQALRRAKVRMNAVSAQHDEFWVRTGKKFRIISMLEGAGCGVVVLFAVVFHRTDLLAAGISLVVGIHFLPLASLMHFPEYYAAGIAIILCDLFSVAWLHSSAITFSAGVATGVVLWTMALYALLRSRRFLRDPVTTKKDKSLL
jgi:hypothetical protein